MSALSPAILSERVFWPRMSEVIGDLAEAVQQPPERPLDETEKAEVLQFERDLIQGRFGDISSEISLDETPSSIDTAYRFAPSYFTTAQGSQALQEFFPRDVESVDESTATSLLRSIPVSFLNDNKEQLKKLSGDSMRYAKARYSEAAVKGEEIEDIPTIEINRDPEVLIARLAGNFANRRFMRTVRKSLRAELDSQYTLATEAKLVVTDIYRDKIHSGIAELYPGLQELLLQIDAQPLQVRETLMSGLGGIKTLVNIARTALSDGGIQSTFVRRLDFVRNGVALNEDGKMTTIHRQTYEDAAVINAQGENAEQGESLFSNEEIELLDKLIIDAEGMRELTLVYMERIGIKGWDVEIRSDVDSVSVDGLNKKVKIPKSFKRTPTQVSPNAGVVALMKHEVGGEKPGHVMQHINAENDDLALRLGTHPKYKGKRVTSVRETGGITSEAVSMREFFGQERKAKVGFARAMEVIESGGTVSRAIAASILASVDAGKDTAELNDDRKNKRYVTAADSVLRLTRFGGFNSQPLVYVESATGRRVLEPLDDETEKIILAEGIFDPVDMLRLHRFGLLVTDTDHLFQPAANPSEVMAQLIREKLAAASGTTGK